MSSPIEPIAGGRSPVDRRGARTRVTTPLITRAVIRCKTQKEGPGDLHRLDPFESTISRLALLCSSVDARGCRMASGDES